MDNMKRIKVVGLCLVAVFALGAVAAASAMAAKPAVPAYEKCVKAAKVGKKYAGAFSNKECTNAAAEGKYRLEQVDEKQKLPFTVKSKNTAFKVAGDVVKCGAGKGKGEIAGEFYPAENVTITFAKCDVNGNKKEPCENITTQPLHGELYYTSKEENAAEILLGRGTFAEIKCGAKAFVVESEAIGTVKNSKKGQTMTFAVNASGEQALRYIWEGEHQINTFPDTLEYEGAKEVTLETTLEETGPKGVGVFF